MPLRLNVKKNLHVRTDRVKSVDIHPTEPWVCAAKYSGKVSIYNNETKAVIKQFDAGSMPTRCAKFIARKQWVVCACDDMCVRVWNYNTMEKIHTFEAHGDYIRYLEVHPTRPLLLTCGDDMVIKMWNWERGWELVRTFEAHSHYVMMVKFNPKDPNFFASASLDRTLCVWGLTSSTPHFTLRGHKQGVNCVDYYPGGAMPYLVSGGDDNEVLVWDYQTRSVVARMQAHTAFVTSVAFHPKLPLILSSSEDGTVRVWHSGTYRLESTLNYAMERCWTLAATPASHAVAFGFDEGLVTARLGKERPVASMDRNGRLVWARNSEVEAASVRGVSSHAPPDGEPLSLSAKELGSCDVYPQTLVHNSNGRFVAACGEGEYIIYTAQVLRNKAYGSALDFAWSALASSDFATRESTACVRVHRNFKEAFAMRPALSCEALFGGALVAVASGTSLMFFSWETGQAVRLLELSSKPRAVYWNDAGDRVAVACEDEVYVLRYEREAVEAALAAVPAEPGAGDGVDDAFALEATLDDVKVQSGAWCVAASAQPLRSLGPT